MRTILNTCLALLIFSGFASANLRNAAAVTTTPPLSADVNNFLSGVWEAIGLGHDFDDFASCVQEDANAGAQLQKAMALMNSSSASDVSHGLNKMDKVVSPLVAGLKACDMKDKYTATIKKIVDKFTNPDKLTVQTGSSIQIDNVEVYSDISAGITACSQGSYAACGSSIGAAMGKVFYGQITVTSVDQVAQINSIPDITWTAADIPEFNKMTLWQFKKNRVTLRRKKNELTSSVSSSADEGRRNLVTIPAAFDSRTNWPNCIHPIRDQKQCGSCWAFSASEVLSDRFCIVSNQTINLVMSPQYLVSCDTQEMACNGGYLYYSWKFLEKTGDVTDACFPYKSGAGAVPACSTFKKCADNSTMRKYYAKTNSTKTFTTPAAIQTEVLTNGPVEAGMDVYSDFMSYRSGIYTNTKGATYAGGHAVKIVGWGNSNGTNYWVVANSWGTYWGESGFFRIKFGSCGIDKGCYAGLPDLTRS
jgi:cathepsin B